MRLLPIVSEGDVEEAAEALDLEGLPEDATVTVRVYRFFEELDDEAQIWEKELRNVNSGSLLWLLVHMKPKMHSVKGAKYGTWFTAHYVRVRVAHFKSQYHMCEGGGSPHAKTFGSTPTMKRLVGGDELSTGYFWFASPDRHGSGSAQQDVRDPENLEKHGWQHIGREQPLDGHAFLADWAKHGSPMDERALQTVLHMLA
mmetsp:Transcript_47707/g.120923  ORF Transcript_47707/g.120923 Transcript_47707/m.120923 type:complete len:200 (-) Transcript_47707:622-1221(-)